MSTLRPFEQGRSFESQFTARRMNDIQRAIPRVRFAGTGILVSHLGDQTFVTLRRPKTGSPVVIRPFFTYDVSAGGPSGLISVTGGTVTDLTNSGNVWSGFSTIFMNDPIAGNVPFAFPLVGPPIRQPYLKLNSAATCCYLNSTIDASTGFITAMEIDADTGSGVPLSTSINWYQLLSHLTVTIISGVATVSLFNDGAQSSLYFAICGLPPLTDGNSYRVGT